jgi:hypothetical protein
VTVTLVSPHSKTVHVWHMQVRAGVSVVTCRLPAKPELASGTYHLKWNAVSGADSISRTLVVQIGRTAKAFRKPSSVDVLVAGDSVKPVRAVGSGQTVDATSEETAFELTGDPHHNVQVVVIDADQYTLSMIHDLHLVFPLVKLIALSDSPSRLTGAVRAGATVGLPRTTPASKLAKVVRALSGVEHPPASRR